MYHKTLIINRNSQTDKLFNQFSTTPGFAINLLDIKLTKTKKVFKTTKLLCLFSKKNKARILQQPECKEYY